MTIEALAIALLVLAALAPLVIAARRHASPAGARLATWSYAVIGVLAVGFTVLYDPPPAGEAAVVYRPIEVPRDGYVTSNTCKPCHAENYGTWHASYHRTMTQVATPEAVLADFDTTVAFLGTTYRLEQDDDAFWVSMRDDDEDEWERNPVVMITGSHHRQYFWMSSGRQRELHQLPIIWLIADDRWIPFESALLQPPDAPAEPVRGRWNFSCINCHTTHGQVTVTEHQRRGSMDTQVAEFGIACERCHGPAEEHIRANQDPMRRFRQHYGERDDPTIVDPADLSRRLASQVCGQCHADTQHKTPSHRNEWMRRGILYRPGDDLEETRFIARLNERPKPAMLKRMEEQPGYLAGVYWSDGMARVTGTEYSGLIESPCYSHGDESRMLSCVDCHSMHQEPHDRRPVREWANDQLKAGMDGDQACLQCHEAIGDDIEAHTHHPVAGEGSRCYNCHMPYTVYGLFTAVRSHQVSSPTIQETLATGRPNACNQCHLDRTLAWAGEHLETWWGTPQPELTEDERTIPASVLWALRGDAGQRALTAWSMNWDPAREASGTDWMPPYLCLLLDDPYAAVRFVSERTLRGLPGFADFPYDFVEPEPGSGERMLSTWLRGGVEPERVPWQRSTAMRVLAERDDKPVRLLE